MKLPVDQIKLNEDNPRFIKDFNYERLLKSIKEFPEMAEVREVVVNKDYVVLGGNMRFRAMKEAGWTEIPVRVVDWPEDKQKEFVIKDNVSGGDWDWEMLANKWDTKLLTDWGLDLPDYHGLNDGDMDDLEALEDVLGDDLYHLNITFETEDDLKAFLAEKGINLDKNFKKVNKTISIRWPLEKSKRDVKNIEFT